MNPEFSVEGKTSVREAYKQFLGSQRGMMAYNQFKRLLYTGEDSLIQSLNNNVLQHLPVICKQELKVCDIGGGDGKRIIKICKYLHDKFALHFRLDFVEQSACLMRAFDVDEIAEFSEVCEFETLFENAQLGGGYDLVLLIHSIFAFQDETAIDKILSLPNVHGVVIAVSNAPDSFVAGLKKLFDAEYADGRFEITDLEELLRCRNRAFRTIPLLTKWAISNKTLSRDMERILDWLSLGKYQDLPEAKKKDVWRYIRKESTRVEDRVLFSEDEVILVISPPS